MLRKTERHDVVGYWARFAAGTLPISYANSSRPPIVRKLQDDDLKVPGQPLPFGHCSIMVRRTQTKGGPIREISAVREGGSNNDAPRLVPAIGSLGREKVSAYHLAAVNQAYSKPFPGLNIPLLQSVSTDKKKDDASPDALTIMHLCGNKWCLEGTHLFVGRKKYNDGQVSCHRHLQMAGSVDLIDGFRRDYCPHAVKCWAVVYKDGLDEGRQIVWE